MMRPISGALRSAVMTRSDQRHAVDFHERFIGQPRCAGRHRIGSAAGEDDRDHAALGARQPGAGASGTDEYARAGRRADGRRRQRARWHFAPSHSAKVAPPEPESIAGAAPAARNACSATATGGYVAVINGSKSLVAAAIAAA